MRQFRQLVEVVTGVSSISRDQLVEGEFGSQGDVRGLRGGDWLLFPHGGAVVDFYRESPRQLGVHFMVRVTASRSPIRSGIVCNDGRAA